MIRNNERLVKIINKLIIVFLIIFLLSISNSIFVNQVGYYGVLLLLLAKYWLTKKNPFSKSGLELPLIWYMLSELISLILSPYKEEALQGLMKRYFLIPMIYTTAASINNFSEAKRVFKIYIGGTLITVMIYLYFSFNHYISNLYSITESGPSVFQYPITASEILTFTVLFLFAFFVNEKTSVKNKILLFAGFALSLLALFSTYKRTGWMGAAAGILIILILKKQWKIIIPGLILILIFFLTQKNVSDVNVYELLNNNPVLERTISTEGKAYDVYPFDDKIIISDYNEGLEIYKDSILQRKIDLPGAVIKFSKWQDNYYLAYLIDTRFLLLENKSSGLSYVNEFISPGMTYDYAVLNNNLFVVDKDSGLTVFTNPEDPAEKFNYNQFSGVTNIYIDSNHIAFKKDQGGFEIYELLEGNRPGKLIFSNPDKLDYFYYSYPYIFTSAPSGFKIHKIDSINYQQLYSFDLIKNVRKIVKADNKYFVLSLDANVYIVEKTDPDSFDLVNKINLGYIPQGISADSSKLYLTHLDSKRSRLLSIIDPYHPSNLGRLALWSAGFKMFLDRPIFGLGDIDLAKYFKVYKKPYQKEIQGHLHNNFIHILATLGLFGLSAVCFLFYKIILIDLKIYFAVKTEPFISSYSLGAFAAFIGFLVSGLTELNFWDHEITTLIWFTFGLNLALLKSVKPENEII